MYVYTIYMGTHLSGLSVEESMPEHVSESRAYSFVFMYLQTVYNTKGTRAHTHRELIRKWLWEPKGSSPDYI